MGTVDCMRFGYSGGILNARSLGSRISPPSFLFSERDFGVMLSRATRLILQYNRSLGLLRSILVPRVKELLIL